MRDSTRLVLQQDSVPVVKARENALASKMHSVLQLVWVVKQGHIGDAFFDVDAAVFLKAELERSRQEAAQKSGSLGKQNGSGQQRIHNQVLEQQEANLSINAHQVKLFIRIKDPSLLRLVECKSISIIVYFKALEE